MNDVVTRSRNKSKDAVTTVPKRDIFIVLPFLGFHSKVITQQLKSCIYKFYGCFNLELFCETLAGLSLFFPTRTDLDALSCQRSFTRQAAGTVTIFTQGKQSVD